MNPYEIGIICLGVMGRNPAMNIESRGYSVCGYDIDPFNWGPANQ